jgi:hypothetical protein
VDGAGCTYAGCPGPTRGRVAAYSLKLSSVHLTGNYGTYTVPQRKNALSLYLHMSGPFATFSLSVLYTVFSVPVHSPLRYIVLK